MRFIAVVLGLIVCAMVWQHVRYLRARREIVQDRQPVLYPSSRFHVITFLDVAEGSDVIAQVGKLKGDIEASGPAQMVYAGQAAFTVASTQLGPRSWDAVVLVQYPSRESYDAATRNTRYRDALAGFAETYSHGMKRSCLANLMLPQFLLGLRFVDVIGGHWNVEELVPAPTSDAPERGAELEDRVATLLDLRSLNDEALVIFNLTKPGDRAQREADRSYGRKMLTRMAGLAHGPMHVGSAVTLEGDASFANVAIVYYPGVSYFAELVRSRFFQGIIGDKQLGDTLVVPTVPILSRL